MVEGRTAYIRQLQSEAQKKRFNPPQVPTQRDIARAVETWARIQRDQGRPVELARALYEKTAPTSFKRG